MECVAAEEFNTYPTPGGEPLCNLTVIWVDSRRLPGSLLASQLYRLRLDPENEGTAQDLTIRWVLKHLLRVDRPSRTRTTTRTRTIHAATPSQLLAPSSITDQIPVLGQIRKTGEKGQCYCDRENQCTDPGSDILGGGREVNPGSLVNTF